MLYSLRSIPEGRSSHSSLRPCNPTSQHISPLEVSQHNKTLHQVLQALRPGPIHSPPACRVSAKLLLATPSKMIQTMKTLPTYRTSYAHTTQKWVVPSRHGYRRIRRSLWWHFHHSRVVSSGNTGTRTAATEQINMAIRNRQLLAIRVDEAGA